MRHFVQMGCCDQFPRWLAGHEVYPATAAQIGKVPLKNVKITREIQNQDRAPKYLETIMSKEGKAVQG
tara:strand:+ start:388 stop:591 length:204 start_codon:yes stop_codon:yes gene_type:complete